VVLVAVAALVFGIFQLKDSVLGSAGTSNNRPVDAGPQDPQGSAPTAPVSTTAKPSASSTPTKPVTASTPTINRAVKVKVYNSTSRTGLAKGAASKLSAANWNADSAGNQQGFSGSTTVYYTKASLRATAKAIAKDLGGYPVRESTAYGSTGVIVILAGDYSG
jgi:CCR4-NOT transcriptional regulation complex NOT5 subunit